MKPAPHTPFRRPLTVAVVVLLAIALAGCGFRLRDALVLPPDLGPVQVVSSDPYSPLAQSLVLALERAGATTVSGQSMQETASLQLLSETMADTPISVDQFGRAQEFTLHYAVVFALRRPGDGADLVPSQAVELSRDYVASPSDALGKNSERELLSRELMRDMTQAILRRIEAASRAPGA
jgi:LPS-assembly lipoprotein